MRGRMRAQPCGIKINVSLAQERGHHLLFKGGPICPLGWGGAEISPGLSCWIFVCPHQIGSVVHPNMNNLTGLSGWTHLHWAPRTGPGWRRVCLSGNRTHCMEPSVYGTLPPWNPPSMGPPSMGPPSMHYSASPVQLGVPHIGQTVPFSPHMCSGIVQGGGCW